MKKALLIAIILLILAGLGYMGRSIMVNMEIKKKLVTKSPMPEFNFQSLDGQAFNKSNLVKDVPVMIVYFSPTCDHCQSEAQQLEKHMGLFEEAQILMVSPSKPEAMQAFAKQYKLDKFPQIRFLRDDRNDFFQAFGSATFPTVYVYNKYHTLAEYYKGGAKMELIHKVMNAEIK